MKLCAFAVEENQKDIFCEFFAENDVTEVIMLKARSFKKNNFLQMFYNADTKKVFFIFKIKETHLKKLQELCTQTFSKNENGILMILKKENSMKTNKETKNDKLVVTILKSGFTELITSVATQMGVSGATILSGKGIGACHSSFLGMGIDSEREIILIATQEKIQKKLENEIKKAMIKNKAVNGICFSLPLENFKKFNEEK